MQPVAIASAVIAVFACGAFPASLRVERLSVDTTGQPRFSWTLAATNKAERGVRQTAYRILVATSAEALEAGRADAWDSGKVSSSQTIGVGYRGKALQSLRRYFWQVQVWDQAGRAAQWSQGALVTVLPSREWKARWIAAEPDSAPQPQAREYLMPVQEKTAGMPLFRHDFQVTKPLAEAVAAVCGLGQYELRLNGKDVTDTVLNPGWTNYRRSVLYNTYEVSGLLHKGANAIGVLVGNGMYNVERQRGRYTKFSGSFGQPKLILELHLRYQDGTEDVIASDGGWKTHAGPIVYSSTYGGEDFDARLEPKGWDTAGFDAKDWAATLAVEGPGGELEAQQAPPIRVMHRYEPVAVTEPRPGVRVYDLGQNMSGWPEIRVEGGAGDTVKLIAGELLDSAGLVSQHSAGAGPKAENSFSYTLRGGGPEQWHPRFSYWGFRYVQVEGTVLSLLGDFLHDDLRVAGRFTSSDELLNRIHTLIDMAILSNSFSVLTDCPHREKLGWLEQTYLNGSSLFFNYDYQRLYEKLARDMAEAQLDDGMIPGIAPEYVAFVRPNGESTPFRDSPEWGSAAILSPWTAYQFTGDRDALARAYPMMARYAAYLRGKAKDGLLAYGLGDWYDIGPGNPGVSQLTSTEMTASATYYYDLTVLARAAGIVNKPGEAARYTAEAAAVKSAFNSKLFHAATNEYDRGSQTANAMALVVGLVPAGHESFVLENLISDIRAHQNHVTAGDVGFHYVVRALTDAHRSDVLYDMLSRTDSPSYGDQLARGATTLTEAWDTNPNSSQNHFMLGHGEEWFYRGLAGIQVDMSAPAEARIRIRPQPVGAIASASASYDSVLGMVRSSWTRSGKAFQLDVEIPPNATAIVEVPASDPHAVAAGEKGRCSAGRESVTCSLPSGSYRFSSRL